MSAPFTNTLGELSVERTLAADPALPCVQAVHPDGSVLRARALAIGAGVDAAVLRGFEAAAAAAARLSHPAIAAPRHWSLGPPAFVATDMIEGERLAALAEPGALAAPLVIAIAADLAEALEAAHAAGVVHGGVGIDAVVVSREGRAVLGDFAIAGLAAALVNAHSQLLGSVAAHLAPEQLNALPTSAATDVFALGSALYRLLTGAYPFDAPSPMGMTLKLSMGIFEPIEAKAPATPPALSALVRRMLAQAPSDRPSARDVVLALLEIAPREDARRAALRDALPPAPERPAGPRVDPPPSAAPRVDPPPSAAPRVPPPSAAPRVDPPPIAVLEAAPPARSRALPSPPAPEPSTEWVDAVGFDDGAATEFAPELERAIARDAGIAGPLIIRPPSDPRPRTTSPTARQSTPHASAAGSTSVVVYAAIAAAAILILIGAALTVIALVA